MNFADWFANDEIVAEKRVSVSRQVVNEDRIADLGDGLQLLQARQKTLTAGQPVIPQVNAA